TRSTSHLSLHDALPIYCYCYYHCCHKRLKLKLTKIRLLLQTIISWTIIFPLIICHASLSSSSSYKRHATCRLGLTSFNCGTNNKDRKSTRLNSSHVSIS